MSKFPDFTPAGMPARRLGLDFLWMKVVLLSTFFSVFFVAFPLSLLYSLQDPLPTIQLKGYTDSAVPIPASEFYTRQTTLAETLHRLNASAYIAEPGASAQYYANISRGAWFLSERPFLLIITPDVQGESVQAKLSILTPKFEATRAKLLSIPSVSKKIEWVEWAEEVNPYERAASAEALKDVAGKVFVDGSIRNFVVDGMQAALPSVKAETAPREVNLLRERKSAAELSLMKKANEATVLAIRHVRSQMYIGMHESDASLMMEHALSAAGLKQGECLVLFGENAALPHGSGTDRVLGETDFALFDCTAELFGYYSDVTRTIALADSKIPEFALDVWYRVREAQAIAIATAHSGVVAKDVDNAARSYLDAMGYGWYFTHRLGHGIGLEVHEQPYLNGGSEDILEIGHTFSDEPGVYIEGDVGVRIEDCFYIDEYGVAEFLTAGVGGQSSSPWYP